MELNEFFDEFIDGMRELARVGRRFLFYTN